MKHKSPKPQLHDSFGCPMWKVISKNGDWGYASGDPKEIREIWNRAAEENWEDEVKQIRRVTKMPKPSKSK